MMKAILFLAVLLPLSAEAKWNFGKDGPTFSKGGGSGIKFRLLGGLRYQRATMMSKNDFVEKRSLNGVGVDSLVGLNMGPLIVGAGAAYTKFYQSTDKKDVGGTDTSGDLTSFHGAAGLGFGKFCLLGRYIFKADYKLSQKTAAKETATYSKPDASYGLSLLYRPGGRSFWSIDYTNVNFTEGKLGSTKLDLKDSKDQINLNSFGITYGFMF